MKKNIASEGAGNEYTDWTTPGWLVDGLVDYWPELIAWSNHVPILEPEAGGGAIVKALVARGAQVEAIEVRDTRTQLKEAGACRVAIGDFLKCRPVDRRYWFTVVMNPPFRPAPIMLAHVRRALEMTRGFVACLLPLSFLSGGNGRREFWVDAPPLTQLLFFDHRPKFVGSGGMFEVAWFIWAEGHCARPTSIIRKPRE